MPTPQPTHGLSLHARHTQQVFGVGQIGRELGELGVEVCLACMSTTDSRNHDLDTRRKSTNQLPRLDNISTRSHTIPDP